jgi:phospholipid/cholesterol/gamma-HCH transport system ATP-binding protein
MTNKTEPIIQVESITAAYDDTVILKDVSLYVNRGEVLAILGGSGCGKSTLMKQMIGLEKPVAGRVLIDGRDIVTAEGDERLEILRQIGVMYQSGALFGSMTLEENVCLPLEEFTDLPPEAIDLIARMKLSLVGLAGFEKHMPSELSGGMRKRAAIARALALDPQVLFMDELSAVSIPSLGRPRPVGAQPERQPEHDLHYRYSRIAQHFSPSRIEPSFWTNPPKALSPKDAP